MITAEGNNTNRKVIFLVVGGFLLLVSVVVFLAVNRIKIQPTSSGPTPTVTYEDVPSIPPASNEGVVTEDMAIVEDGGEEVVVAKNRLIVKFRDDLAEKEIVSRINGLGAIEQSELALNYWLLVFDDDVDISAMKNTIVSVEGVEEVVFDNVYWSQYTPNDYSILVAPWWLDAINAQQAWDVTIGLPSVLVGIADSPIRGSHIDLSADIAGLINNPAIVPPEPPGNHGTHVAGTAAGVTNNFLGIASIGHNVKIIGATACEGLGSACYTSWMIRAVSDLTDAGVRVINMSFGSSSFNTAFEAVVQNAWARGVVLVAAAGNDGTTNAHYPAAYANVIAVAASDSSGGRASFSTHGSWVEVAAPGVSIVAPVAYNAVNVATNTSYASMSGTSMAAPIVSGLAALCISANPTLTNSQVRDFILTTAHSNSYTANGLVDAKLVLESCAQIPSGPPASPTGIPTSTPTPTPFQGALGPECYPPEWQCSPNVPSSYSLACSEVWAEFPESELDPAPVTPPGTECRICANRNWEAPQPIYLECPTEQDFGQSDGTGQRGMNREYYHPEYERGGLLNVPPLNPSLLVSSSQRYGVSNDALRSVPDVCGFPTQTERTDSFCEGDAPYAELLGKGAVYSTVEGVAYRCVATLEEFTEEGSLGVYVVVANQSDDEAIFAHLGVNSLVDAYPKFEENSHCFAGSYEVARFNVQKGDLIGTTGRTGDSRDFMVKYILKQNGKQVCPIDYLESNTCR